MFCRKDHASLSSALIKPKKVRKLTLKLTEIDCDLDRIGELFKLERLQISWQELENLPIELAKITTLKELVVLNYNTLWIFQSC